MVMRSFVATVLNHSDAHGAMLTFPKHRLSKVVKLVVVHDQTVVDERSEHRYIGVNPWKKVLLVVTKYGIRLMSLAPDWCFKNISEDIIFCGSLVPLF